MGKRTRDPFCNWWDDSKEFRSLVEGFATTVLSLFHDRGFVDKYDLISEAWLDGIRLYDPKRFEFSKRILWLRLIRAYLKVTKEKPFATKRVKFTPLFFDGEDDGCNHDDWLAVDIDPTDVVAADEVLSVTEECCSERDKEVLRLFLEGKTLRESGLEMGLTCERVRQLRESLFKRVRDRFRIKAYKARKECELHKVGRNRNGTRQEAILCE